MYEARSASDPAGKAQFLALPYYTSCMFQSWIEDGPFNRVYIWCIPHSWTPSWNLGNGSEWGSFGPSRTCFWKKAILRSTPKYISISTLKCIKIVENFQKISISAGRNLDFRFNYTPTCMVLSMNFKIFRGGAHRAPSPRPFPRSISGFAVDSPGALRPRFGLRPQFTPPTCLITPLTTEGTRANTVFPKPQLSGYTIDPIFRSKIT